MMKCSLFLLIGAVVFAPISELKAGDFVSKYLKNRNVQIGISFAALLATLGAFGVYKYFYGNSSKNINDGLSASLKKLSELVEEDDLDKDTRSQNEESSDF